MDSEKSAKKWQCCTSSFIVIEIIFFLFKVSEAMLDPSVRLFIYQGICLERYANDTMCLGLQHYPEHEAVVQTEAAHYIMYYKLLLNLPAMLLGLFCGAWSDRVGRKLPVVLAPCGSILGVMCYMLSILLEGSTSFMLFILLGAAVRGAFGKSAVMTMALHSYVSDTSDKEERTKRFGKLLSMNFFGYFVGSLLAGSLLKISSFDVVFCTVVFINCFCVIIAILFMKESVPFAQNENQIGSTDVGDLNLSAELSQKSTKKPLFHWKNIVDSVNVLFKPRDGNGRCHLLLFFFVIIAHQICKSGETDATLLFVERYPLAWERSLYGYLLAVDYASLGVAVFFVLPFLVSVCGLSDLTLVVIGMFFKIVRLMILAFSTKTWMVYLSVTLGAPSAMIVSGMKSLISKSVDEDELGKAFSVLSSGETVSNLLGAIFFTSMYTATFHVFGGLTFAVDAVFYGMMLIGIMALLQNSRTKSHRQADQQAGPEDKHIDFTEEDFPDYGTTQDAQTNLINRSQRDT